ncbi:hypothetical protein [Blastopirellula marina]|uniref:hypothetical protein n=1 Tax=Blastopirellula marina TaxID=124 RepID=UPI00103F5901|nr:hypothetical protein [Blastopirellula marina]
MVMEIHTRHLSGFHSVVEILSARQGNGDQRFQKDRNFLGSNAICNRSANPRRLAIGLKFVAIFPKFFRDDAIPQQK